MGLFGSAFTNLALGAAKQADQNYTESDNDQAAFMKQRAAVFDKVQATQDAMDKQASDIATKQNSYMQLYGVPEDMAYGLATNPNVDKMSPSDLSDYVKSLKPTGNKTKATQCQPGKMICPGINQGFNPLSGQGLHGTPMYGPSSKGQPARCTYAPDGSYMSPTTRRSMLKDAVDGSKGCMQAFQSIYTGMGGKMTDLPQNFKLPTDRTGGNEAFDRQMKIFEVAKDFVAHGGDPKQATAFLGKQGVSNSVINSLDLSVYSPNNTPETKAAKLKSDQYYQDIDATWPDEDTGAKRYLADQLASGTFQLIKSPTENSAKLINTLNPTQEIDPTAEKALMDTWVQRHQNSNGTANNTATPGQINSAGANNLSAPNGFDTTQATGMKSPGNLDPWNRKVLQNPDGSYSTTSSISIGTDNGEVLIPTVVDGKRMSNQDAIAHYKQTGENLGTFDTPDNADKYAQSLHNAQATNYTSNGTPINQQTQQQPKAANNGNFDQVFNLKPAANQPRAFYDNTYNRMKEVPKIDANINQVINLMDKDPAAVGIVGEFVKKAGAPGVNAASLFDQVAGTNYATGLSNTLKIGDRSALEAALTNLQTSLMRPTASSYQPNNASGMGTGGAEIQNMWHELFENGDFEATAPGLKAKLGQLQSMMRSNFTTDLKQIGQVPDLSSQQNQEQAFNALRQVGFDKDGAYQMLALLHKGQNGQ